MEKTRETCGNVVEVVGKRGGNDKNYKFWDGGEWGDGGDRRTRRHGDWCVARINEFDMSLRLMGMKI